MNKNKKTHLIVFFAAVLAFAILVATYTQDVINNMTLGLDLQGGFEIVYEVSPLKEGGTLPEMSVVSRSVSKRVDVLGVSEPQIMIEGDNRIRVQLAGVKNQEQARRMISSTANISFRDVNDELLADGSIIAEGGASLGYDRGIPVVSLKIADKEKFAEITRTLSKKPGNQNLIVTWLDFEEGVDSYVAEASKQAQGIEPKFISVAGVNSEIYGDAVIQGSFTDAEARELADLINSGSLPVKMTEVYSNVVSADYGFGAFTLTARAGVLGVALVGLFMVAMYGLLGAFVSGILALYIFAVFGVYGMMGGVLTLPGIAALVLGVGMAVDANVITFERIKDEILEGSSVPQAIKAGQSQSFITIFDAQFTTFLAALIMYIFGTGSVKGFATMLMVTLICTMIFNVGISRFLLSELSKSGILDQRKSWFGVKEGKKSKLESLKTFDYLQNSKICIIASVAVLVLSVGLMAFHGVTNKGMLNLGIDFSSGTKITVSANELIDLDEVKTQFEELDIHVSRYQQSGENTVYVTIKEALSADRLDEIKTVFTARYGIEPNDNIVTPVVGQELVKNAVQLTLLAWVAMLLYVTVRFKWDYAISCIVALIHDVGIVLAIFSIFRLEVNTELISVCLAIIGYSINNSIVVFDRIRQVVDERKDEVLSNQDYKEIVNTALGFTFSRSLYSSITTLLPVIALLVFGSDAIITFNFAMFVGLVAGTLSSMFIAPTMWYKLRTRVKPVNKKPKKVKTEALDEMIIPGIND